jgi:hypothetical protein
MKTLELTKKLRDYATGEFKDYTYPAELKKSINLKDIYDNCQGKVDDFTGLILLIRVKRKAGKNGSNGILNGAIYRYYGLTSNGEIVKTPFFAPDERFTQYLDNIENRWASVIELDDIDPLGLDSDVIELGENMYSIEGQTLILQEDGTIKLKSNTPGKGWKKQGNGSRLAAILLNYLGNPEQLEFVKNNKETEIKAQQRKELELKNWFESVKNSQIEKNDENIAKYLKYLNLSNWGLWNISEGPNFGIGYKCNQFDCDGKVVSTITFDNGEKYSTSKPAGHLNEYETL